MRAILQRVSQASVEIEGKTHAAIGQGLLILLGIEEGDSETDSNYLIQKTLNMRIFSDDDGKMNLSVQDIGGEILVVSQFTLHASTKKGNRPSFIKAAKPDIAIPIYEEFKSKMSLNSGLTIKSGVFGANMQVALVNDGPVTIFLDSKIKE